jgi:hypothetical protein
MVVVVGQRDVEVSLAMRAVDVSFDVVGLGLHSVVGSKVAVTPTAYWTGHLEPTRKHVCGSRSPSSSKNTALIARS